MVGDVRCFDSVSAAADSAIPPSAPARRGFLRGCAFCAATAATGLFSGLVEARDGVEVGETSKFTKLVSAEQVEQMALQQYRQTLAEAQGKRALAPEGHPQLMRLRAVAERIVPFSYEWNPRARQWRWEVNLIGSKQINAWCMPGGKIAFYTGILEQLELNDAEVAAVMGHEVAHALREHARERMGKSTATSIGARVGGALIAGALGIDPRITDYAAQGAANLLTLKFSREDESEADLVGIELAARAGYNPRGGITLWEKMSAKAKGAPPQWLSTHPAGSTRIHDIEKNLPKVMPLYERAPKAPA
ncbi:MAG: M48 family peptidase [Betaproteobacteria bacterium]|jgi:predicted Zn-dependent protease|nr:M48 family peptidase [Betaproteobacteria bacterium]NBS46373.1 M48 family peptidase [Betaproteobacteria bacterium]